MIYELEIIDCIHRSFGDNARILEYDNFHNYILECGCTASPKKPYGDAWAINDELCENNLGNIIS